MTTIIDAVAEINRLLKTKPDAGNRVSIPFLPSPIVLPYHVDGVSIVSTSPIIFDMARKTELPEVAHVLGKVIRNCASQNLTSQIGISKKVSKGWKTSKSTTIGNTTSVKVSGGFDLKVIKGGGDITWTESLSTTEYEDHSETTDTTLSVNDTVTVAPWTAVRIEVTFIEGSVKIPFSIKAVVDGELWPANPDLDYPHTSAAAFLTEQERTFVITGEITVSDAIQAGLTVETLTGENACPNRQPIDAGANGNFRVTVPLSGIPQERLDKLVGTVAEATAVGFVADDGGPTIGAPDGINYEVLYTTQSTRSAVECGVNDLGLLNPGTFETETRRYTDYANGTLIREWTEQGPEKFVGCASV